MSAELRRIGKSFGRVARTRYPGFIFGFSLADGEIPVFTYHDVTSDAFRTDLEFLRLNGYRTLSIDEYQQCKTGRKKAKNCVLLTFDDARRSFYDIAFPLLKEYGAKATLFVPTLWMRHPSHAQESIKVPDEGMFMNWDQLRECARSDVVDIQSHAYRHALVYISSRLVGFVSPAALRSYHIYDWPMRQMDGKEILGRPPLGTPIYDAAPLLSANCRVLEQPATVAACLKLVEASGKEEFFNKKDWRRVIRKVHDSMQKGHRKVQRLSEAEHLELVETEFRQSQSDFQRELGYHARFLAYPWMLGSTTSLRLAKQFGMEAVFGVSIDYRKACRASGILPAYGRLKEDWLRFLPGQGRRRIQDVIPRKLAGFLRSQHLAH